MRYLWYFWAPAFLFGAIWFGVIKHYYVPTPIITNEMVERGRDEPKDTVLNELSTFSFFGVASHDQTINIADKLLQGEVTLPGEPPRKFHLPFDPKDINNGSVGWQLFQATLGTPRILLAAYRMTGREEFFITARDVVLSWASYERTAILPKGFVWNDHSVAGRILALADFWAIYRRHPTYDPETARAVFEFVARSGYFLADPAHFTASTNHGVMQNLALWHMSLAFPSIPESKRYQALAFERFAEQMAFYINEEGFVLEHSAEYHKHGLQFLSMALRYLSLQGVAVPPAWQEKYEMAKEVYAQLRRPDGTLPMFGDTKSVADREGPLVTMLDNKTRYGRLEHRANWIPSKESSLYPVAGYSIWWTGLNRWPLPLDLSQTVVAWSYFPGQAHKHADEMSVLFWANGQTWWTNVGYWSYGSSGRSEAQSWGGSNAPHLIHESASSKRMTRLLGSGQVDGLSFLDLERNGPEKYVARRQVAHAANDIWVTVDHVSGDSKDRSVAIWTAAHDVQLNEGPRSGTYLLEGKSTESTLAVFVVGSDGTSTQNLKGSQMPFGGWEVVDSVGRPASAILIEQPAKDSWSFVVWALKNRFDENKVSSSPSMQLWQGPENWTILLPTKSGTVQLSRNGNKVFLGKEDTHPLASLTLNKPAGNDSAEFVIKAAHDQTAKKYPKFIDGMEYRLKATVLFIVLLVVQEILFFLYKRITMRHYLSLRGISNIAWMILGMWLIVIRVRLV